MSETFNIYCDESCHLEHDHQDLMTLGALWHEKDISRKVADDLRALKRKHSMSEDFEIKWTKVSESKKDLYLDLVNYFFENNGLKFRTLVAMSKSKLNHPAFTQTHDEWYYKMYFHLLNKILTPGAAHLIYLDIKDTRSATKIKKLREVLCNARFDFNRDIIARIQSVRSQEVQQIQMVDLLIGAVSYTNRTGLPHTNKGKNAVVDLIKKKSGYSLQSTTLMREEKFNIFVWTPTENE